METLLTEIIRFSGTAKGFPACKAGPQRHCYFSTLRVLKPLGRIARAIMDPRLLQRRMTKRGRYGASRQRYCGLTSPTTTSTVSDFIVAITLFELM
jgi:hypothetical protein